MTADPVAGTYRQLSSEMHLPDPGEGREECSCTDAVAVSSSRPDGEMRLGGVGARGVFGRRVPLQSGKVPHGQNMRSEQSVHP